MYKLYSYCDRNLFKVSCESSGVGRKKFRGFKEGGPVSLGVRGRSPPDAGEFSKISKKFPKKVEKMLYYRLFSKDITKLRVKFSRLWTNNTIRWGNIERILKILKNFHKIPEENCKNGWILDNFAMKLQNHGLNFRAFGRKTQLVWEILRNFWKSLMKIQ